VVIFLKEGGRLEGRNADLTVAGIEASIRYAWDSGVAAFANGSLLLHNELMPRQRATETDAAWDHAPVNATVPTGRYPDVMANVGVNAPLLPHANVNVTVKYVGSRRASLVNNQLMNPLDLNRTYELASYVTADITVETVGLRLWPGLPEDSTVLSVSARGIPGGTLEPGSGGDRAEVLTR
jgi:hypothetical protein